MVWRVVQLQQLGYLEAEGGEGSILELAALVLEFCPGRLYPSSRTHDYTATGIESSMFLILYCIMVVDAALKHNGTQHANRNLTV